MKKIFIILIILAAFVSLMEPGQAPAIVEFNAVYARDPFIPVFPTKEKPSTQEPTLKEENIPPPQLTVQGLFWGTNLPQAIVKNKVVGIGDKIEDAQVLQINKEGITVSYKGKTYTFQPESPVLKKEQSGEGL